jgi:hypothetical protein
MKVPPKWAHTYNFYNAPISSDINEKFHPFSVMKSLSVKPDDFVSFKLDIDTPEVEIPIALELLKNSKFTELVDEFFFELHFRCEFLKDLWGYDMPEYVNGLKLSRAGALEYFAKLRHKGIRSHFWP